MSSSVEHALQQHATAMRSLARALVGDQHADDVLQETALQALQRGPARPGLLRGWLVAILRHMASNQRRAARRQQQREAHAVPPPPEWTPAETAEHRDTLRQLTAVLTALPEPYQSTLLLRFFEDLTPAAIAAKTGVPLATVKSRLQRGIAMLRERLGAEGRSDWRPALGAAFGLEVMGKTTAAATVAVTGVLLMSTGAKLALSGVAALLALAAWFWFGSGALPEQQPVVSAADAVARPATADLGARTPGPSERRDVTPPPPGAAASELAVLRGRCVDESGRPLPRCEVELRGSKTADRGRVDHSRAYGQWLVTHPDGGWRNLQVATGDDGRFEFAFTAPPLDYELRLRRDVIDFLLRVGEVEAGEPKDLGDLPMATTCLISGRVVDSAGVPAPGLEVYVADGRNPDDANVMIPVIPERSESGAGGIFTARVVAGSYEITVDCRKVVRGGELTVAAATSRVEAEVVVEAVTPADTISGFVVDALGQPVPAARVCAYPRSETTSDTQGRFTLFRPRERGERFWVGAEKDGRSSEDLYCNWGTHELRIVLSNGAAPVDLELRVTTAAGEPVTDFVVHGCMSGNYDWRRPTSSHDDGIVRYEGVPAGTSHVLVEPDRWDLWNSGFVALPVPRGSSTQLDIRLPAATERLLRVLRQDATPAADVAVELLDPRFSKPTLGARSRSLAEINGPDAKDYEGAPAGRPFVLQLQRGTTDANGELRLHGPAGTTLALRLPGPGHAPVLVEDFTLDAKAPLVVTLPAGARLEGRFGPLAVVNELREAGGPKAAGKPRTWRERNLGFRLRRGEGATAEFVPPVDAEGVLPEADGSFLIDSVPPGTWQLTLLRWEDYFSVEKSEVIANVELRAGETTSVAVDLPDWLLAYIEGQVIANGAPFAEQSLTAHIGDGSVDVSIGLRTDAEGRFRLRTRQGMLRLAIYQCTTRFDLITSDVLWSRERVFARAGEHLAQDFHLDSGTLRLRLLDADDKPVPDMGLYLRGKGDRPHATSASDADGRITIDVEPGTFTLLAMPRSLRDADRKLFRNQWQPTVADPLAANLLGAGTVTAKAGETVELDVHLPPEWNR